MLARLRARLERAAFFGKVIRATRVTTLRRPAQLVRFARAAWRTRPGPHLTTLLHAIAHPEKEALVQDAVRLTWAELDAQINRVANALAARATGAGSRVALMLPNGSAYLIAQQALARVGATAVQIGYRLKPDEIAHILANAQPHATIVHADYLATMCEARTRAAASDAMLVVGEASWDRALAAASPELPPRVRRGDGGGVIVYTSGTTGKPKGANRAWRRIGFESVADMIHRVGMRADDRHLVACPLYHSGAPAFAAIMLSLGATLVLAEHFDPEAALATIARERVTCTLVVPTMLVRICALPEATLARYDTSSLRWVMSAAAPLATDTARRFMARFGPILWNFYGSTETGLVTLAGPDDHVTRPGTIGRALRGNAIRLVDDAGRDVPPGQVGELYVRNRTLYSGYHADARATRDAQRDGRVSVGDLARVDADGYYYLESRKHDMVISGGVNIYPREIEDVLMAHPAILDAAVIGAPDPEWGETLHAFVVLRDARGASESELIDYCRSHLADYKRPRTVTFLPELPRNPTGKVLKRELRARS